LVRRLLMLFMLNVAVFTCFPGGWTKTGPVGRNGGRADIGTEKLRTL
jgi:hypothetical protein